MIPNQPSPPNETTPLHPSTLSPSPPSDTQVHHLPRSRLLLLFPALALIQLTSFLDQTAITTALPLIASALHTGASTPWIASSFLTTSTSIQLLTGPLSNIFSRKTCLLSALLIMGLGNLLSGFSPSPAILYITRAFAGLGAGAINALVQITISDVTRLGERGYWFGVVGLAVAVGNGTGPLIGGALTERWGWRWAFWFVCPLTMGAMGWLNFVLPGRGRGSREDLWGRLRGVDWFGVGGSMVAIVLILIPLSRGGSAEAWKSPVNITMLIVGIWIFISFLIFEFQVATTPILPLRLFQYNRSTNILIAINILIGWLFWGNLFYIPLYLQVVRGFSPSMAGTFILPMVLAHGATSCLSGIIISICGTYVPVISVGAWIWAIGAGVKTTFGRETPIWLVLTVGALEGIGVGCSLQPVLVGLLAGSDNSDRAVITGLRNFVRDIGSAVGITVSGVILNRALQSGLGHHFSPSFISQLTSSTLSLLASDSLSDEDRELISCTYMEGLHRVFVSYAVLATLLFLSTLCLRDYGLKGKFQEISDETR